MDDLILKYFLGTANEDEKRRLRQWVAESEENKKYFLFSKNIHNITFPPFVPSAIDEQKALHNVLNRVRPHFGLKFFTQSAAALIAITLISVAIVKVLTNSDTSMLKSEVVVIKKDNRAVLTLTSGEKVLLDKNTTQKIESETGVTINMEGGQIKYNTDKLNSTQEKYNEVYVPNSGEFYLVLEDGTKVWINAETKLKYPTSFVGKTRTVYLEGEAYFEVAKDTLHPFRVVTPKNEVTVLGTSFDICAYEDQEYTFVTLSTGKVAVNSTVTGKKAILLPGEQVLISNNDGQMVTRNVDASLYSGWKDGKLIFESNSLKDIFNRLTKYYDVTVDWQNETLKNLTFTGEIRKYETIDEVLRFLEKAGNVKFNVRGNIIEVK